VYYVFETSVGPFFIVPRDGRWHIMFDDESLGSYVNAIQAADDLAGGHTFSPGRGIDTAALGIPENIGEWTMVSSSYRS
jgi:hypothetical protein